MELKKLKCLNALDLKVLAMAFMLLDHVWATLVPSAQWMTNLGRLAFPIFAFQIAEGYFQTHSFKKYLQRVFLFALISEIPFNLMYGGSLIFPFHQNVLFSFCTALLLIRMLDWAKGKNRWLFLALIPVSLALGFSLGFITMVDFYGFGIVMTLLFYLTHGLRFGWVVQLLGLGYINCSMMGGLMLSFSLFGHVVEFPQQGLALLALIPIWLYNGKQGPHSKVIQYACYAFYPLHILLLSVTALYIL